MWTEEKFLETYKKFCKKWDETFPTSEKPKPLFKEGVFDQDNWNGCDLIRKYLCDYYYENNADDINGIEIFVVYKNDEWDAVILDYVKVLDEKRTKLEMERLKQMMLDKKDPLEQAKIAERMRKLKMGS